MTTQRNNPLHGITLQQILEVLVADLGWQQMAQQIKINCFTSDPSIKSSLTFLRKTSWARLKVEQLYLATQQAKPEASFVWPEQKKPTDQKT